MTFLLPCKRNVLLYDSIKHGNSFLHFRKNYIKKQVIGNIFDRDTKQSFKCCPVIEQNRKKV